MSGVSEGGGARSTNGIIKSFRTDDCPAFASAATSEIDLTPFTQIVLKPESSDRRVIIQDDDTNIVTNIQSADAMLVKADEYEIIDCAGDKRKLYVAASSLITDGLRTTRYDES